MMVEDEIQRIIYHDLSRNHQANELELDPDFHPGILPTSLFFTDKLFLEK